MAPTGCDRCRVLSQPLRSTGQPYRDAVAESVTRTRDANDGCRNPIDVDSASDSTRRGRKSLLPPFEAQYRNVDRRGAMVRLDELTAQEDRNVSNLEEVRNDGCTLDSGNGTADAEVQRLRAV